MRPKDAPSMVRYLGRLVKSWTDKDGTTIIEPFGADFRNLGIAKRREFFDAVWSFLSTVDVTCTQDIKLSDKEILTKFGGELEN